MARASISNSLLLGTTLLAGSVAAVIGAAARTSASPVHAQPLIRTRAVPVIHLGALAFRDLDRNGRLDPYEDWRLPSARRAADLLSRMTLDEKLGQMMHGSAPAAGPDRYDLSAARTLIVGKHVTALITRLATDPKRLAEANNALQEIAEDGRLGIPVLLSSDPRNQLEGVTGASVAAGGFTPFPDPLGLAAIGNDGLTRRFADVVRREYAAVGIRMALSPQADIATEPRWPRIDGTFGADPALAARMVGAYVAGVQDGEDGLGATSVAAVVKHWVGYGAAANQGFDSRNRYGRFSAVTNAALPLHVRPFQAAFAARVAAVMPMYSVPRALTTERGRPVRPVGAGFSRYLVTDLLRHRYGFSGLILSDWKITDDCNAACRYGSPPGTAPNWDNAATPWGMEDVPAEDRFAAAVNAGIDQFGGTTDVPSLAAAVHRGKVSNAQVNRAVLRILDQSFRLGLFENPFVGPDAAARIVGNARFQAEGRVAQARSLVVLENRHALLPLSPAHTPRVFAPGMAATALTALGFVVVAEPARADVAIVRLSAPHQLLHPNFPAGAVQHEGALSFPENDPALVALRASAAAVPTIVVVHLDRPAILTTVRPLAAALLADFGATDAALLDALTGRAPPEGRLPFELPASMAAVEAQNPALPHDSAAPLYPFGFRYRQLRDDRRRLPWTRQSAIR